MTTVFVYGTLKRGGSNHAFLQGQQFLGEGRTQLQQADLVEQVSAALRAYAAMATSAAQRRRLATHQPQHERRYLRRHGLLRSAKHHRPLRHPRHLG